MAIQIVEAKVRKGEIESIIKSINIKVATKIKLENFSIKKEQRIRINME